MRAFNNLVSYKVKTEILKPLIELKTISESTKFRIVEPKKIIEP